MVHNDTSEQKKPDESESLVGSYFARHYLGYQGDVHT